MLRVSIFFLILRFFVAKGEQAEFIRSLSNYIQGGPIDPNECTFIVIKFEIENNNETILSTFLEYLENSTVMHYSTAKFPSHLLGTAKFYKIYESVNFLPSFTDQGNVQMSTLVHAVSFRNLLCKLCLQWFPLPQHLLHSLLLHQIYKSS